MYVLQGLYGLETGLEAQHVPTHTAANEHSRYEAYCAYEPSARIL